jgi:hypothetical protein
VYVSVCSGRLHACVNLVHVFALLILFIVYGWTGCKRFAGKQLSNFFLERCRKKKLSGHLSPYQIRIAGNFFFSSGSLIKKLAIFWRQVFCKAANLRTNPIYTNARMHYILTHTHLCIMYLRTRTHLYAHARMHCIITHTDACVVCIHTRKHFALYTYAHARMHDIFQNKRHACITYLRTRTHALHTHAHARMQYILKHTFHYSSTYHQTLLNSTAVFGYL